jgi:anti-sigma28 factor (negative regulator of flagellin synthesis)
MRIDPSTSGGVNGAGNTSEPKALTNALQIAKQYQAGSDQDQAYLSSASDLVSLSAGSVSSTRQAKIDSISRLLQSGQYNVDAGQVASAIVDSMLQGA